jgi:hypothetical protein
MMFIKAAIAIVVVVVDEEEEVVQVRSLLLFCAYPPIVTPDNSCYHQQGDQIVRFFAYWVIVNFGQIFLSYRSSPNFGITYFLPQ